MNLNDFKDASNYDFSGKRVRFNGKCLTKFDLGLHLDAYKPSVVWSVAYDAFSYSELVGFLKSYLYDSGSCNRII